MWQRVERALETSVYADADELLMTLPVEYLATFLYPVSQSLL